ncbi:MAG TPA: helix-turn-helix transcriptional regulator [Candidatus Elarobacter sp.]|jgi:predicted XRE-type DNA-binding protein|nr:helix-turn-helix transcriptional regulator [Candidatus Elarobacter sp.]
MKRTTGRSAERVKVSRRTGNVFAQLRRPEADDLLRKSRVLSIINEVLEERHLDQSKAAEILKIDQADVSRLMHGKLSRFSLDRLMTLVDRLNVAIDLHQDRDANGHLVVRVQRHELAGA